MEEKKNKYPPYFSKGKQVKSLEYEQKKQRVVDLIKENPNYQKWKIEDILQRTLSSRLYKELREEAIRQVKAKEQEQKVSFIDDMNNNPAFLELVKFTETYIGCLNEGFQLVNNYWREYLNNNAVTPKQIAIYQDFLMKGALVLNVASKDKN